ncbi:hypothetical protein [Streptomyces sp. NPDC059970]|uniref:hypothetical protein n=1 Tax=Streptomyces sp. NPDC059970 TaxID=3347019 RepID=UPI00369CBF40
MRHDLAFQQPHVLGEPLRRPLRGLDAVIELVDQAVDFLGRGLQAGDVVAKGTQLVVQVLGIAEPGLQPLVRALQIVQPAVEIAYSPVGIADPPVGVPELGVQSVAHFPASCPSATAVPTTAQPVRKATMNQGDRTPRTTRTSSAPTACRAMDALRRARWFFTVASSGQPQKVPTSRDLHELTAEDLFHIRGRCHVGWLSGMISG